MAEPSFRAGSLDHVHVFVPDRDRAVAWYRAVLGLEVVVEHAHWAADGGPLTISADGGQSGVALFEGAAPADRERRRVIAFRVDGEAFAGFVSSVATLGLVDRHGEPVTSASVVDHGEAFSIYFADPWGNPYEITSYDVDSVRTALGRG